MCLKMSGLHCIAVLVLDMHCFLEVCGMKKVYHNVINILAGFLLISSIATHIALYWFPFFLHIVSECLCVSVLSTKLFEYCLYALLASLC